MQYILAPSRYLRQTFECIRYLWDPFQDQKKPQKGKNGKYALFWALLEPLESLQGSHGIQKQLQYILAPSRYIRQTFERIRYMWDLFEDQKQPQKGKNSKKCSFRAFLEPPESPQGSHGSQKQLQYILAPSRYLRQTFECIKYMWDPFKNQKRPQKRQKWQKCSFRANMGHDPEIFGYFLPHNPILWVEIHIIPV